MSDFNIFPVLIETVDGAAALDSDTGTEVAFQAICTNPVCGFTGELQPTYDAACDDADDHTGTC